ncbi:hypothetical protein QM996_13860 [Sinorhizobium chiapasense]
MTIFGTIYRLVGALLAVAICSSIVSAQSFSCPIGKNAACLDYGDKVCSTFGKCVDGNAVCFNNYTCDFKGFVCKSSLEEVVEQHDNVVRKYNTLVTEHKALSQELSAKSAENEENVTRNGKLFQALRDAQSCVNNATTLEEAQDCSF